MVTHGQGEGYGGGDAHRLTPKNTVPLLETKFDPLNREKMKFSMATPPVLQKPEKNINILYFFPFHKIK